MFSLCNTSNRIFHPLIRCFSTHTPVKPVTKLVAEIRKRTETSILKAREALVVTNNDLEAALRWIDEDLTKTGEKRVHKLTGRVAKEGLVATAVLSRGWGGPSGGSARACMVELNCETDFVGRNSIFDKLARDIAWTAAFYAEASLEGKLMEPVDLDALGDAPLLSTEGSSDTVSSNSTVSSAIRDMTTKVGERVHLRRAVSVVSNTTHTTSLLGIRVASYVHGSSSTSSPVQTGRIGSVLCTTLDAPNLPSFLPASNTSSPFLPEFLGLERALARQIVGFDTTSIQSGRRSQNADEPSAALYDQPFIMYPTAPSNITVGQFLTQWSESQGMLSGSARGIEVVEFARWTVGEELDVLRL